MWKCSFIAAGCGLVGGVALSGCATGVSQSDVDALEVRIQQLETSLEQLQSQGLATESWVAGQGYAQEDWVIDQVATAASGLDSRISLIEGDYVTGTAAEAFLRQEDLGLWNHGTSAGSLESFTYGVSLHESDAEIWKAVVLRPEYDVCRAIRVVIEASLDGGIYDSVSLYLKAAAESPTAGDIDGELMVPIVSSGSGAYALTQQFWIVADGQPLWARLSGVDSTDLRVDVRQVGCLR